MSALNSADGELALPPKPDPTSGVPHPPPAPREWHGNPAAEERDPSRAVGVPRDQGPALEAYTPNRRSRVVTALQSMGVMVAGITLLNAGFGWVSQWFAWVFIVGFGAVGFFTVASGTCAAGAEWFACGKRWVKQYELTSITVRMRFSKRYLHLVDRDGRKVVLFIGDAQENQELWDLVYNGIRHSVAAGAETNWVARRALELRGVAGE